MGNLGGLATFQAATFLPHFKLPSCWPHEGQLEIWQKKFPQHLVAKSCSHKFQAPLCTDLSWPSSGPHRPTEPCTLSGLLGHRLLGDLSFFPNQKIWTTEMSRNNKNYKNKCSIYVFHGTVEWVCTQKANRMGLCLNLQDLYHTTNCTNDFLGCFIMDIKVYIHWQKPFQYIVIKSTISLSTRVDFILFHLYFT